MKTFTRRIAKLEDQLGSAQREPPVLLVMSAVARELALDEHRCIEILRECGHLPTSPGFGIVNFCEIPEGLNAEALESFLREHGGQTRGFQGVQET